MNKLLSICSVVAICVLFSGCPAGVLSGGAPSLEVGRSYTFISQPYSSSASQQVTGTITQVGPGNWVLLTSGEWVNTAVAWRIN